jgi:CBS domain-containing protein
MLIRDVLRRKGSFVATVPPDTTVDRFLSALAEHNVGALVVSSDGVTVDGIASERDVVRALCTNGPELFGAPVAEIMTRDVAVAAPADRLEQLMRVMTEQRIRHVPVLDGGRLAGIISIGDVVKSRMDELEVERESLIGYIRSGG